MEKPDTGGLIPVELVRLSSPIDRSAIRGMLECLGHFVNLELSLARDRRQSVTVSEEIHIRQPLTLEGFKLASYLL